MFLERTNEQGQKVIRQTNGQIGATISDPDIYRVDPDTGVATFYNPDTGRPFTGDNPRAQAMQWVEMYNQELKETFNRFAGERKEQLEKEQEPVINLLKFTPTFEKLDPVRQRMLEALLEDYEIYDADKNLIGYSVDLNKALEQVNRQVAAIKADQQAAAAPVEPVAPAVQTGPAVDMPTGSGTGTPGRPIDSVAAGLEALEDAKLAKLRSK